MHMENTDIATDMSMSMITSTVMSIHTITAMRAADVAAAITSREASRKRCFPICWITTSTMLRSWLRWRRSSARQERKMWRYRLRKPSKISIRAICI